MKVTITDTTITDEVSAGHGADFELYGTWDGASIDLQLKSINGDWNTIATYTEDVFDKKIETRSPRLIRFNPTSVGAGTSVKVGVKSV